MTKGNHNTEENYERVYIPVKEALDRAEELKDDCLVRVK